jgi:hypothetical protein
MQFVIVFKKLCVFGEVITGVLNMIHSNIKLKIIKYLNFLCFSTPYTSRVFFFIKKTLLNIQKEIETAQS